MIFVNNNREVNGEYKYLSYCPAIRDFCARGNTIPSVIEYAEKRLKEELQDRFFYNTLKRCGWEVSENSAKPPIFAKQELVSQTEYCYGIKISNPIIIEIDVELPKAEKVGGSKFDNYDPEFGALINKALAYNPRKKK